MKVRIISAKLLLSIFGVILISANTRGVLIRSEYINNECNWPDYNACDSLDRATCTDVEEGYICECRVPFATGDGTTCIDVDECELQTHNCSTEARCVNTDNGYKCACNAGYMGDGFNCEECKDSAPWCESMVDHCNNNRIKSKCKKTCDFCDFDNEPKSSYAYKAFFYNSTEEHLRKRYIEARRYCMKDGGDLAQHSIRTEKDRKTLFERHGWPLVTEFWLGITNFNMYRTWKYLDGSTVDRYKVGWNYPWARGNHPAWPEPKGEPYLQACTVGPDNYKISFFQRLLPKAFICEYPKYTEDISKDCKDSGTWCESMISSCHDNQIKSRCKKTCDFCDFDIDPESIYAYKAFYYKSSEEPQRLAWLDARRHCLRDGGDLAYQGVKTEDKRRDLFEKHGWPNDLQYLLGLSDRNSWSYVDGTPVDHDKIGWDYPAPYTEVAGTATGSYKLDTFGMLSPKAFICEYPKQPGKTLASYLVVDNMSWNEARRECKKDGAVLAFEGLESTAELRKKVSGSGSPNKGRIHLGIHSKRNAPGWKKVNGEDFNGVVTKSSGRNRDCACVVLPSMTIRAERCNGREDAAHWFICQKYI